MHTRRRFLSALASLGAGGLVFTGSSAGWIANLSTVLGPSDAMVAGDPTDPRVAGLVLHHVRRWESAQAAGSDAIQAMRATNPEWDFMGRTFLGLALLELALNPATDRATAERYLAVVDGILVDTFAALEEHGPLHFLLGYANRGRWRNRGRDGAPRSLFVDGELLALTAARAVVAHTLGLPARFGDAQARLADQVAFHLDESPLGHGESYPDECWAFCNAFAAKGLVLDQRTAGRDHTRRLARYRRGLEALTDPVSGMLVSEYTPRGEWQDGPEGSSIFLTSAHLRWTDPQRAQQQWELARDHLVRSLLGFSWAREWPDTWRGAVDVDSGPIIPVLDASAGASGLAFVGASAFDDDETLSALLASLELAAFPTWTGPDGRELTYAASNAVGDAVLLYALVQGPLLRTTLS
jgi:hypothetical protein